MESWNDHFDYGQKFTDFLIDDNIGILLESMIYGPDTLQFKNERSFIKASRKSFSLVKIYFEDPQMTVIT